MSRAAHRINLFLRRWCGSQIHWENSPRSENNRADKKRELQSMHSGDGIQDRRHDGATGRSGCEHNCSQFRLPAHTPDGNGENEREDARFEEQCEHEHGCTCGTGQMGCEGRCDYAGQEEEEEDAAGFDVDVQRGGEEAAEGEDGVADCLVVEGGCGGGGVVGGEVLLEEGRDGFLSANVAEVGEDAEGEGQVHDWNSADGDVAETEVAVLGMLSLGQSFEFVIGSFWDGKVEENESEDDDEERNAEIGPLDVDERGSVVDRSEKDLLCEYGRHNGANGLDTLRYIEADFGIFWRTAEGDERVASRFESGYAKANNEVRDEESWEGGEHGRGPKDEGANAINAKAGHKGRFEAPSAENDVAKRKRSHEVSTVVR